jgi:hypothetical protein
MLVSLLFNFRSTNNNNYYNNWNASRAFVNWGRAPFAPNFVAFRDRKILNVPLGTPPVGDPSPSRYPSKSASAGIVLCLGVR